MPYLDLKTTLPLYGSWKVSQDGQSVSFISEESNPSHGLILLKNKVEDGVIRCNLRMLAPSPQAGIFILFRGKGQERYYAAGLGGWDSAYSLGEGNNLRITRLSSAGNITNLIPERNYSLQVTLEGQRVQVFVDEISVIDYDRLTPTGGTGIGFFAFRGTGSAEFSCVQIDDRRPSAFIAMQFSEPYNEVYKDAIQPLVSEIGYEPVRVDEIVHPGMILSDISQQLTQSSIVIAEVSEPNPNVYYEVGLAHALGKPTVLLAQKGTNLPFDIAQQRCIMYENTIPGRGRLQSALRTTLTAVLGIPERQQVST